MQPILFHIGSFPVPAWHTFYLLGAIAAYALMIGLRRRKLPSLDETDLARLYAFCYVAGYVGARALSILIEEPQVTGVGGFFAALAQLGPMTFYGGFLAALAVGAAYARVKHIPLADVTDVALPAGLLALAIGRVGCFLNGDDYGKAVPLSTSGTPWWAVTFPNLQDGIARYPVQLLEAGLVAALVAALVIFFDALRKHFRPGAVALFAIIGYANLRFALEFLRDDFRGFVFGTWLSTSQFVSILLLLACGVSAPLWIKRRVAA